MPHYIPPDITDVIISAVATEDMFVGGARTHTLAMCALVCRAWLPRSRAKLFEFIWIKNQRSYDLLIERVLRSETMSRYLISVNGFHIYNENAEGRLGSAARLFLVEFAGKLPGLRDWFVLDNDWTLQRPSVKWPLLLSQFHTITTLRLENCRFACFSDVRRLLTALPLISALDIWYLTWPTVSRELRLPFTLRSRTYWPKLNALHIGYDKDQQQCVKTFLRWITAALGGSAVKELSCGFFGLPPTGALQESAVAFGGRLQRSVIDLDTLIIDSLALSEFIALERLSLDLFRYQGNWEDVASVLQDVASTRLRSITFKNVYTRAFKNDTSLQRFNKFDQDTLEELDRVLSREGFRSLQEVVLKVHAPLGEDQEELLRAHARRFLSKLHERKIIRLIVYRRRRV